MDFLCNYRKSLCDGDAVKPHAAKPSLQRLINNQILDYRAILKVSQEEMKSIIFFGIDIEDMVEVREKIERRFEDGKTVSSTRSSHHFIPHSASQIEHKLCSEDDSFVAKTSKFQLELILGTLHHRLTSLACTICCGGLVQ